MDVCLFCVCCVLSGRGFCDGLITRPEESYRMWCVVVCDQETSWYEEVIARAGLQNQRNNKQQQYCLMPNSVAARSNTSACSRSLAGVEGFEYHGAWIFVPFYCCMLSGRGNFDGLITHTDWSIERGVSECDHEASKMRRTWPTRGCCAMEKEKEKTLAIVAET
jgi:hypothetical protein